MTIFQFITLKDFVYIITIAGIIYRFVHNQKSLEEKCDRVMAAIFHERGGLNVVSCEQCKQNRDIVFAAIRRYDSNVEKLSDNIHHLNDNVLKILFHLKIDTKQ